MATRGTIKTDFSNGYRLQIVWEIENQEIEMNLSEVLARVQLVSLGAGYDIQSSATKSGALAINGVSYPFTFSAGLNGNQTKTLFSKRVSVTHDPDGDKKCLFSCECAIDVTLSGVFVGTVKASKTEEFTPIPRATIPTLSDDSIILGDTITISTPRASGEFTHTLRYVWGRQSGLIKENVTTSATWSVPLSLATGIPNGVTGSGSIVCETYRGSTLIGTASVNFTGTVPDTIRPTISSVSVAEAVESISDKFGLFVQNQSKLKVTVNASGIYSSIIKDYKTTVGGITYTTKSFTTELLTTPGPLEIVTTVTDSRGKSATFTETVEVLPYEKPTISLFNAYRCDSAGNKDDEGTSLKIDIDFEISPLGDKNDKTYTIEFKESDAPVWSVLTSGEVFVYKDTYFNATDLLNADKPYMVRLRISDYFSEASYGTEIATAFTLFDVHESGRGFAFGKVAEILDLLDIALKTRFRNNVHFDQGFTYDHAVVKYGSIDGIVKSGKYYLGNEIADRPVNLNGWLDVQAYEIDHVYQKYITYTGDTYERIMEDGTWGDWCGTFSSEMWTYEKKLDGALHMWGEFESSNVNFSVNVADSWYRPSSNFKLSFPEAFIKAPLVFFSTALGATAGSVLCYTASVNTSASSFWTQKIGSGVANLRIAVEVIGKWK